MATQSLAYLYIYVSTQKFPQTFLYRSKKYCKSFKSFEELRKKIFSNKLLPVAISRSAKNSMILTAPYSEVSSAMTNLFLSELHQYKGNMFKKRSNVIDTWFRFYSHFKKGTFGLPYDKCWRKRVNIHLNFIHNFTCKVNIGQ